MDIWILTSFLAAVFSGFEKITHRFNMLKVKDVYSYTIIFQFLCAAIVSPAVVMNPVFPNVAEIRAYVFLILAAACWAGFSLLTFHADKYLEASVKSGISRLRLVWASIIGYLFFNESFSLWQFAGGSHLGISFSSIKNKRKRYCSRFHTRNYCKFNDSICINI
ncbi:DMT family transporter [Pectobacteriaceae bacterium C52]|nr:DMT family transporter [Pectobacteriaceae bacterium C52]